MAKCVQCGRRGLTLKLTPNGLCLDCAGAALKKAQEERDTLKTSITPEMQNLISLRGAMADAQANLDTLQQQIASANDTLAKKKSQLDGLQKEIISAEDTIALESFSMYRPKYALTNSEEYKKHLDDIRSKQKEMIKAKIAAASPTDWTVNNSISEGRKMVSDTVKLFLRSFNNECDMACEAVRFNTFDRCLLRITKSYETINKLGRVSHVAISHKYLALKIEELRLCLEYAIKKQEEKEEARALRAEQREQAKVQKEIEAARKAAEKEKTHYQQALSKLNEQLSGCADPEKRKAFEEKRQELLGMLEDIQTKLEDIDYRQANQRAGYVYIISNIGAFGEGVYKIGMTRRLDPMERVDELGDASVPFYFDVHAMIFSDDAPKLEAALHHAFEDRRVNMINRRREYFRVSLDEIKEVVRKNHDKTVEFVDTPPAAQYRQTVLMSKAAL